MATDDDLSQRFAAEREAMVREQLERRGIRDARVLEAMRHVPREAFVDRDAQALAYDDGPLPIGKGQTISQPYIVALMLEAAELQPGDRVLEVGAGSGYAAAVASRLAQRVVAIERHPALADAARGVLAGLGVANVEIVCADGSAGWPAEAPYDAILVAAAAPRVPDALVAALAPGGRLVLPVGATRELQRLRRIVRRADGTRREDDLGGVAFVPLIGEAGWPDS